MRRVIVAAVALCLAGSTASVQNSVGIPVPLSDPLGLGDGVEVRLERHDALAESEPGADPQRSGADLVNVRGPFPAGSAVIEMPALEADDFPVGVAPSRLEVSVRLGDVLTLRARGVAERGSLPGEVEMTEAAILELNVSDDSNAAPTILGPFRSSADTARTWLATDACAAARCRYRLSGASERVSFDVVVEGDRLATVLDILGNDVTPNRLTGKLSLTFEGDLPDDVTVDVTLHAPSGTAYF